MFQTSRIRLLLVITALLPQAYRTYETRDISSFSLLFTSAVAIICSVWFILLLVDKKRDNYTLFEAGILVLFYGFITINIILQRSGRLPTGESSDKDNILTKGFLSEFLSDVAFSGIEAINLI